VFPRPVDTFQTTFHRCGKQCGNVENNGGKVDKRGKPNI